MPARYTSSFPSLVTLMTTRDRVAAAYDEHYDALKYITTREFRVPDDDAEQLIHDVYLAFMRHHASIANDGGWLAQATRNACRNYWRDLKPTEELPAHLIDATPDMDARLDLVRLLSRLTERCRQILARYAEGFSAEHIARACAGSTSKRYGRNMISACLSAARAALSSKRSEK
jgi:DNA-directed RNA polymerase specialized sigma24 family protein